MRRLVKGLVGALVVTGATVAAGGMAEAVSSTPFMLQWGTAQTDGVGGVTVSSCGHVYVGGTTMGKFPGQKNPFQADGFLSKVTRKGAPVWTRQFGTNGREHISAIAYSPCATALYVAGYTDGAFPGQTNLGGYDAFVAKYSTSGTRLWIKQYGTAGDDMATGIAVASGWVYVSGTTSGDLPGFMSAGGTDGFLMKLSSGGTQKWATQLGSPGDDEFSGVAVNKNGTAIYVSGETGDALPSFLSAGDVDAITAKYDKYGTLLNWLQYGTDSYDHALGIAVAKTGEVYHVGYTGGAFPAYANAGAADTFIVQTDADLGVNWWDQLGTSAEDHAAAVAVTSTGSVYVGGMTYGAWPFFANSGGSDAFLFNYSSLGSLVGWNQFGTAADEHVAGVAVAKSGDAVLAGATQGAFPGFANAGGADAFVTDINIEI